MLQKPLGRQKHVKCTRRNRDQKDTLSCRNSCQCRCSRSAADVERSASWRVNIRGDSTSGTSDIENHKFGTNFCIVRHLIYIRASLSIGTHIYRKLSDGGSTGKCCPTIEVSTTTS